MSVEDMKRLLGFPNGNTYAYVENKNPGVYPRPHAKYDGSAKKEKENGSKQSRVEQFTTTVKNWTGLSEACSAFLGQFNNTWCHLFLVALLHMIVPIFFHTKLAKLGMKSICEGLAAKISWKLLKPIADYIPYCYETVSSLLVIFNWWAVPHGCFLIWGGDIQELSDYVDDSMKHALDLVKSAGDKASSFMGYVWGVLSFVVEKTGLSEYVIIIPLSFVCLLLYIIWEQKKYDSVPGKYIGSEDNYRFKVILRTSMIFALCLLGYMSIFDEAANLHACNEKVCMPGFTNSRSGMFYTGGVKGFNRTANGTINKELVVYQDADVPSWSEDLWQFVREWWEEESYKDDESPPNAKSNNARSTEGFLTDPKEVIGQFNTYSYFKGSKTFKEITLDNMIHARAFGDGIRWFSYVALFAESVFHTCSLKSRVWYPMIIHGIAVVAGLILSCLYTVFLDMSVFMDIMLPLYAFVQGGGQAGPIAFQVLCASVIKTFFKVMMGTRVLNVTSNCVVLISAIVYSAFLLLVASVVPRGVETVFWRWIREEGSTRSVTGTTLKVEEYNKYDPESPENTAQRKLITDACHSMITPYIKGVFYRALGPVLFHIVYERDTDPRGYFCNIPYIIVAFFHFMLGNCQPKSLISVATGLLHVHAMLVTMKTEYLTRVVQVGGDNFEKYLERPGHV